MITDEMTHPTPQKSLAKAAILTVLWMLPAFFVSCTSMQPVADNLSAGMVSVTSPDGTIQMSLRANGPLIYSVSVDGKALLSEGRLGLRFTDGMVLGANARLAKIERSSSDTTWENKLGKRRTVRDHHNELRASFVEASGRSFQVVVRAFNDGIGFRYDLPAAPAKSAGGFVLEEEQTQFSFPGNYVCYAGTNENIGTATNLIGYTGSQESEYLPVHLADLPTDQVRMAPLLVQTPAAWVAITESDLLDWAGMWLNRAPPVGDASTVTLRARLSPAARRTGSRQIGVPPPQSVAHVDYRPPAGTAR